MRIKRLKGSLGKDSKKSNLTPAAWQEFIEI